jgi:hypothetical protein
MNQTRPIDIGDRVRAVDVSFVNNLLFPNQVYEVYDVDDSTKEIALVNVTETAGRSAWFAPTRFELLQDEEPSEQDLVNHPSHYRLAPGVEVIDLTEQLDFLRGNAVKYLARAGRKNGSDELQDLQKARWYVDRAIAKHEKEQQP